MSSDQRQKSFKLSHLPPIFLLLPSAGRANVHEVGGTNRKLVKILAESGDEREACDKIADHMKSENWLSFLGPPAWESVCLGYLIVKEGFLPTGLHVGGTLTDFDIIGHNDKGLILAQCKKDEDPQPIDPRFKEACTKYKETSKAYYFAYGGCKGDLPESVEVVSRERMEEWLNQDEKGKRYRQFLWDTFERCGA
jgi:hypothetical protein